MYYTVSDFARTFEDKLTLAAGGGGMARTVREVAILDYELMPGVKATYQRVNFYDHQLVLSTFLYAKDNPFLVLDAVKYLVSQGTSGLVIKNVLHLPIPEAAIRYANARNFPLFVTRGEFMFDQVVMEVGNAVRHMETMVLAQRDVDALLQAQDEGERKRLALRLNPSLRDEVCALYSPFEDEIVADAFTAYVARFERCELFEPGTTLLCYRNGLLLLASNSTDAPFDRERAIETLRADIMGADKTMPIGASPLRYEPAEAAEAIAEALISSRIAQMKGIGTVYYDRLGALQAIMPHAGSAQMKRYAQQTLDPIREFDSENNGQLMDTLQAYCDHGQSIAETARALNQHPNTIRYRLEKINVETGLSYKNPVDMEQLSLACKIDFCQRVL